MVVVALAAMSLALGAPPKAALSRGKFLVASRQLGDPNFAEAVVLLLEHGPNGSLGVIVNRRAGVGLARVLPQVEALRDRDDAAYFGGPVGVDALLLLVRAPAAPAHATTVFGDVHATGSLSAFRQLLDQKIGPERIRGYIGYAGWATGQLEQEISRGDWYVLPADAELVFNAKPENIWKTLIQRAAADWVKAGSWAMGG